MNNNLIIAIMSLLYLSIIVIKFFSGRNVKNSETTIYKYLLISILFQTTVGILLYCSMVSSSLNVQLFFNSIYMIGMSLWITIFSIYVVRVSEKEDKIYNKTKKIIEVLLWIAIICSLILPRDIIQSSNQQLYATGPAVISLYVISGICLLLIGYYMIRCRDRIKNKKYIPVILLFIFGILVTIIQGIMPELFLFTPAEALIVVIMYFTIENPDMKMIEQLERAKDQADKANRAKTDFLSSMSHEIRTPLNAIMGFSDCINHASTLDEAKENAKDIINASSTLLEIVNGILDISKIEAGKLEIVNSPYNARSTFEELAKLIKPKMQEKGLDFSYYIAPDLPNVLYGDHTNIRKVVTNLLSNAAKYTEKGFVRYEVNCINTENVSKIIISVEDSGRGIKQENVEKLFTKFQRLDEDKNTTIEGTGLGLAITKQLTELMGGKIIVHTVYGEGSKFTVVLNQPIEKKDIKVETEEVKTTLDLKDIKILIVDDNTLNLKVATKLLERYNANSITCSESGFDCLEKINNGEKYDVILMDDMMPKMSGVETLRKLKENRQFKTPVVALTANAITGMKEKYLSEGFNEYLAKPIEKNDLIRVMNIVVKKDDFKETNNKTFKLNDEEQKIEEKPKEKEQENSNEPQEDKNIFSFLKHDKEEKTTEEKDEQDTDVIPVEENIDKILENTQKISPVKAEQFEETQESNENKQQKENKFIEKEKFLRKKGIDLDKALELLGDMEMYEATLKDFYDTADTKWLKIMSSKNTKDLENYAIEVHSLKSDAKYLGFMELANVAYEHELKSKEKDEVFVNNHFNDLEYEYNKVMSTIDEYNSLNQDRFTVMDLPH